jgi:hypothetical protein
MKYKYNPRRDKKRLWSYFLNIIIIISVSVLFVGCNKKKVTGKKQIILISIDTLRGDHLSSYGYFRDTSPNLSKLIEDSVYYPNAYPNGCWTMPSHVSLLTGTLPSRHRINKSWGSIVKNKKYPKLNESIKNIAEVLKNHQNDIKTVKFAQLPDELGFGNGFDKDRRIDPFFGVIIFNRLLEEIEKNKENDFFFFIHTWMVHAPYTNCYFLEKPEISKKQRKHIKNFRKLGIKGPLTTEFMTYLQGIHLFNVHDCVTLYDSGIHYVDEYIGKIINKTRELGIYEDVMFIVVSDHGEHFSEHYPDRFFDFHGRNYYEEFIKVPVIIKYPHRFKHGVIQHPLSLIDVFPTVMDFYDIRPPGYIQGESLLKSYTKRNQKYIVSESLSLSHIERKMIRLGDLKYIITMKDPSKPERVNWDSIIQRKLFDLKNDPQEKNNLYKDLKYRKACIEFEKMLMKIINNSAKFNRSQKETEITEETIKQMKSLGYL